MTRLQRARKLVHGRWLPLTCFVLLAAAVMIGLGYWQLNRLIARRAINATLLQRRAEPAIALDASTAATWTASNVDDLAERYATVSGSWDYANEVVLRGRAYQRLPGVHVLTPLRLDGSDHAVLVDRGWLPYTEAGVEQRRPYQTAPRGELRGIIHASRGGVPSGVPAAPNAARIDAVSRVDLAAIQAQVPYPLLPVWIEQGARTNRLDRQLPIPDPNLTVDDGPHLGYTFQWWAFAVITLAGYFVATTQDTARQRLAGPPRRRQEPVGGSRQNDAGKPGG